MKKKVLNLVVSFVVCVSIVFSLSCVAFATSDSYDGITVTSIGDGTYMISDRDVSNAYLIVGDNECIIIDSGVGDSNFREIVEKYAEGKPISCALTHGHVDHAGAAKQFDTVYMSEEDAEIAWQQNQYVRQLFALSQYSALSEYGDVKEIIQNINTSNDNPDSELIYIEDGWSKDIGGRTITFYLTPGHTAGSGCFYDSKTGYLYSGDMANDCVLMCFDESTSMDVYYESLQKIYSLAKSSTKIFNGHQDGETSGVTNLNQIKALMKLTKSIQFKNKYCSDDKFIIDFRFFIKEKGEISTVYIATKGSKI